MKQICFLKPVEYLCVAQDICTVQQYLIKSSILTHILSLKLQCVIFLTKMHQTTPLKFSVPVSLPCFYSS